MSFGRHKKDADASAPATVPPRLVLNDALVSELQAMARKKVTGALEVIDKAHGGTARLYLYEGGLYSVRLDGYEPRVGARLVASGAITVDALDRLGEVDDAGSGVRAVRAGLLEAETLATVHQEYVLASLGAVLALTKAKAKVRKGDVTDELCTLPLPVEPIFDVVARRAERTGSTWAALDGGTLPATLVLRHTSTALPSSMRLLELAALSEAADGTSGLDTLAARTGLTRAEAVHLAALLIGAGVLAPVAGVAPEGAGSRLAVPEAFGTVAAVAPVRPQPVPVAEPGPEPAPVPDPEAESDLDVDPDPDPDLLSEPVPPPHSSAEPVSVPEPAPVPTPPSLLVREPPSAPPAAVVVPDHVAQLRRELARGEVAELEEALREAAAAERAAIVQAAAIRARLAEARATLGELGEEPASSGETAAES